MYMQRRNNCGHLVFFSSPGICGHLVFFSSSGICGHLVFFRSPGICSHLVLLSSPGICGHLVFFSSSAICDHLVFFCSQPSFIFSTAGCGARKNYVHPEQACGSVKGQFQLIFSSRLLYKIPCMYIYHMYKMRDKLHNLVSTTLIIFFAPMDDDSPDFNITLSFSLQTVDFIKL